MAYKALRGPEKVIEADTETNVLYHLATQTTLARRRRRWWVNGEPCLIRILGIDVVFYGDRAQL